MNRICATCAAELAEGARFCRQCGSPLVSATGRDGGEQVSPQAATIPLSEEGRTTDGLAGEDPSRRAAPETTRVSRAEMDSILQRAARDTGAGVDPNQTNAQSSGLSQRAAPAEEDLLKTRASFSEEDLMKTRPSVSAAPASSSPPAVPSSPQLTPSSSPRPAPSEEDLMRTRPSLPADFDEELTISVPRPFTGDINPVPVQPTPVTGPLAQRREAGPNAAAAAQPLAPAAPAGQQAPPARRRGPWIIVAVVCAVLLVVGVVGALLAVNYLRRPATDSATVAPVAPVAPDQRQLAEEKVVEAEALLASGDLSGAVERLREAVRLDPNHTSAHRRLGDILLETGARREAIEELRAVTNLEPNDFTAWRALAAAQLAEGLPADAAESYKRLVALTGETEPNDLLAYADALRLSGRAEEANTLYQRLSTSTSADVAAAARQRLSELASAVTAPTPTATREARPNGDANANTSAGTQTTTASNLPAPTPAAQPTAAPAPQPTPPPAQLTPAERYRRGVELWGGNRGAALNEFRAAAAAGISDANYYLGLSLVEGRDLSTLKRAEVVSALGHFQRAQSGSNGAQARRYVQQLEKEYDRIRSQ
ncbi:MAG TPA: tetratricopeptide repeat protein [Pyrinomonadaceae bacterium]